MSIVKNFCLKQGPCNGCPAFLEDGENDELCYFLNNTPCRYNIEEIEEIVKEMKAERKKKHKKD